MNLWGDIAIFSFVFACVSFCFVIVGLSGFLFPRTPYRYFKNYRGLVTESYEEQEKLAPKRRKFYGAMAIFSLLIFVVSMAIIGISWEQTARPGKIQDSESVR